jgi:hypothetical protein
MVGLGNKFGSTTLAPASRGSSANAHAASGVPSCPGRKIS